MAYLMQNLSLDDLEKNSYILTIIEFTIKEIIATYAWHGKHHLAHITELKKLKNWS
jgi:cbb3-type cytochrome oxidase subunit 1